jgi:hypothetical protein
LRNNDPIFWPDASIDLSVKQAMEKNYTDCINILQTQWYQADLDQRFTMGDQDLWGLIFPGVATYRRKTLNFNIVQGGVSTISGYQRRNRKSSTCIPVHPNGQKTADQLTKVLFHILGNTGNYQVYSDCFEKGALTQGLGFCYSYIDKTSDIVSGNIKKRFIDMKSTLYDPYFRRHDMSDCRFWWVRTFFDRYEAPVLYPHLSDDILSLPRGSYRDDKFYYMPEVYQIQFPNLMAFDEYWYLTSREATFIIDKESEECHEWMGDEEQLRDIMRGKFRDSEGALKKGKDLFAIEKRSKPTVRRSIIINDRLLIDEANPYGIDRYPVTPCLGYFNPDTPYYAYKFRGVTRDARDSQYLFDRFRVNNADQVEAQQMGLKIKKGALVTPDDAFNQGNGRALFIDPTFQMSDVEKMPVEPPSPVLIEMEERFKQSILDILGVTPEMMGQEIDDKAGIITMIRQSAAITRLQPIFDQFDEFQRLDGDLTIEMVQKNYTYGKVREIIGEEPTPEFDNKLFYKYSCKVALGVLTESQQQLEAQQLLYIKEQGGPVEWADVLSKLNLQNKDDLLQRIKQREQAAAQQQEAMAKLQMQQMQVDNETKLSYARSQDGLAQERTAKIQTDKAVAVEKLRRSKEEETAAALNLIKALKEIQSIDLEQIQKGVEILSALAPQIALETQPNQQEAI